MLCCLSRVNMTNNILYLYAARHVKNNVNFKTTLLLRTISVNTDFK